MIYVCSVILICTVDLRATCVFCPAEVEAAAGQERGGEHGVSSGQDGGGLPPLFRGSGDRPSQYPH